MSDPRYTEGICDDGAAILFDGVPLTVSEVLALLNTIERLQRERRRDEITAAVVLNKAISNAAYWQDKFEKAEARAERVADRLRVYIRECCFGSPPDCWCSECSQNRAALAEEDER